MNTRKMAAGSLGRSVAAAAGAAAVSALPAATAAAAAGTTLETGTAVGTVNIPANR